MKIGDFLNKDYDYVSYRVTLPEYSDDDLSNREIIYKHSTFAGAFEVKNGEIYPYDQDYYDKGEEVILV